LTVISETQTSEAICPCEQPFFDANRFSSAISRRSSCFWIYVASGRSFDFGRRYITRIEVVDWRIEASRGRNTIGSFYLPFMKKNYSTDSLNLYLLGRTYPNLRLASVYLDSACVRQTHCKNHPTLVEPSRFRLSDGRFCQSVASMEFGTNPIHVGFNAGFLASQARYDWLSFPKDMQDRALSQISEWLRGIRLDNSDHTARLLLDGDLVECLMTLVADEFQRSHILGEDRDATVTHAANWFTLAFSFRALMTEHPSYFRSSNEDWLYVEKTMTALALNEGWDTKEFGKDIRRLQNVAASFSSERRLDLYGYLEQRAVLRGLKLLQDVREDRRNSIVNITFGDNAIVRDSYFGNIANQTRMPNIVAEAREFFSKMANRSPG
jgi:hypothetical protein